MKKFLWTIAIIGGLAIWMIYLGLPAKWALIGAIVSVPIGLIVGKHTPQDYDLYDHNHRRQLEEEERRQHAQLQRGGSIESSFMDL